MPYDQYGNWYDDSSSPPWYADVLNNAIWAGSQAAQTAETGMYQPGSNVVYAPQIGIQQPGQPIPQTPIGLPVPGAAPHPAAQATSGIQLSQTTLMLLVGGVLLFMLGGKRGR